MRIILEGLDRCGKSTAAAKLAKHFGPGIIVHHSSSPPKMELPEMQLSWEISNYKKLWDKTESHDITIFDRFHLGMYVYGRKYRDYKLSPISSFEKSSFKNVSSELNYLFTFIDDVDNLVDRDDGMSLETGDKDLIKESIDSFIELHAISVIPKQRKEIIDISNGFNIILPTIFRKINDDLCF